ncbi:MAG: hypothetical protein IH914_06425 [candidate division Zixibacteria bacterium]|nr:hypothetical protein [candidate division Zixibacteria bacterium]
MKHLNKRLRRVGGLLLSLSILIGFVLSRTAAADHTVTGKWTAADGSFVRASALVLDDPNGPLAAILTASGQFPAYGMCFQSVNDETGQLISVRGPGLESTFSQTDGPGLVRTITWQGIAKVSEGEMPDGVTDRQESYVLTCSRDANGNITMTLTLGGVLTLTSTTQGNCTWQR